MSLNFVLNGKVAKDKRAEPGIQPEGATPGEAMACATTDAAKWKWVIEDASVKAE